MCIRDRDELYVDGLNCNPDTFDVAFRQCNEHFKKNRNRSEIKSHHYIISYDPAEDVYKRQLSYPLSLTLVPASILLLHYPMTVSRNF